MKHANMLTGTEQNIWQIQLWRIFMTTLEELRILLFMRSANEGRRYIVTSSLIGWAHSQNEPWALGCSFHWRIGNSYNWSSKSTKEGFVVIHTLTFPHIPWPHMTRRIYRVPVLVWFKWVSFFKQQRTVCVVFLYRLCCMSKVTH